MRLQFNSPYVSVAEITKRSKQVRDQVLLDVKHNPLLIFQLLLNTADLELKVKELFKKVSFKLKCS